MTKLEDITVGSSVKGIISNSIVTIVAVQWYGNNVLEITYKDSHGQPGNQMLLRDEEINLTVMDNSLPWSFDADGEQMKLASYGQCNSRGYGACGGTQAPAAFY